MARPHEVLDVPPDADEATIRSAYRALLKEHHPDHGGTVEQFRRVRDAYEALLEAGDPAAADPEYGEASGSPSQGADAGAASPSTDTESGAVPPAEAGDRTGTTTTGDAGAAATDGVASSPGASAAPSAPVTARVDEDGETALVARAAGLRVALTALTDDPVVAALLPKHVETGRRVGACFRVENGSDGAVRWEPRRVRFVDADGERHHTSVYHPDDASLAGQLVGGSVEIAPDGAASPVAVSRTVPDDAVLEAVVVEPSPSSGQRRALEFPLDAETREALDRLPVG